MRMELIDNKALLLTVPNSTCELIQEHIPKAKVVTPRDELSDIVIHWGIEEVIKLNRFDKTVFRFING